MFKSVAAYIFGTIVWWIWKDSFLNQDLLYIFSAIMGVGLLCGFTLMDILDEMRDQNERDVSRH